MQLAIGEDKGLHLLPFITIYIIGRYMYPTNEITVFENVSSKQPCGNIQLTFLIW